MATRQAPAPALAEGRREGGPESPDKERWMLWMPRATLDQLRGVKENTGQTAAAFVRDAVAVVLSLTPRQRRAYAKEAARRGIPTTQVMAEALAASTPSSRPAAGTVAAGTGSAIVETTAA